MSDERTQRRYQNHLLLGVVLVLIVGGLVLLVSSKSSETSRYEEVDTASSTTIAEGPILPEAIPVSLSIPKLKIDTTFTEPLGLEADGAVEVPDDYVRVGWYKNGPTPGELGPAVILGHVDSREGPAVFFSLGRLNEGDDIFISRSDGSTAHFLVVALERYEQEVFPTAKVYGNISYAGLRLITCTGVYERGKQSYTQNLVVYAKLVE